MKHLGLSLCGIDAALLHSRKACALHAESSGIITTRFCRYPFYLFNSGRMIAALHPIPIYFVYQTVLLVIPFRPDHKPRWHVCNKHVGLYNSPSDGLMLQILSANELECKRPTFDTCFYNPNCPTGISCSRNSHKVMESGTVSSGLSPRKRWKDKRSRT